MALNHPRFSNNGTGKHPEAAQSSLDDRSRRTAAALAPRYDQLNRLWAEAENKLRSMQAPRHMSGKSTTAWKWNPQDPYSPRECDCLALVKYRGEWRLCHGSFVKDDFHGDPRDPNQPTNWRPIADCTVEGASRGRSGD